MVIDAADIIDTVVNKLPQQQQQQQQQQRATTLLYHHGVVLCFLSFRVERLVGVSFVGIVVVVS